MQLGLLQLEKENEPMSQIAVPTRRFIDDFEVVYLSAIVLVGFVLNSALLTKLLTASKQPTVRTSFSAGPYQLNSFTLFKLNLCVADFCILLIHAVGKVIWLITYSWKLGDTGCKLYQFMSALSFYASSNIIVNIAFDRLKQVYNKRPQGAASVRRVRCMLVVSWVLAMLCSIPQLFIWRTLEVEKDWHQCVSIFQFHLFKNTTTPEMESIAFLYEMFHLASVFWIPFALTILAYVVIVVRLIVKHHLPARKFVKVCRPSETDTRTDTSLLGKTPREKKPLRFQVLSDKVCHPFRSNSAEKKKNDFQREYSTAAWRSQLRSRVFRSAMAVVLAHIAMWLPYNCISVMRFVKYERFVEWSEGIAPLLEDLIVVNSLLNPLIYGRNPTKRGALRF